MVFLFKPLLHKYLNKFTKGGLKANAFSAIQPKGTAGEFLIHVKRVVGRYTMYGISMRLVFERNLTC